MRLKAIIDVTYSCEHAEVFAYRNTTNILSSVPKAFLHSTLCITPPEKLQQILLHSWNWPIFPSHSTELYWDQKGTVEWREARSLPPSVRCSKGSPWPNNYCTVTAARFQLWRAQVLLLTFFFFSAQWLQNHGGWKGKSKDILPVNRKLGLKTKTGGNMNSALTRPIQMLWPLGCHNTTSPAVSFEAKDAFLLLRAHCFRLQAGGTWCAVSPQWHAYRSPWTPILPAFPTGSSSGQCYLEEHWHFWKCYAGRPAKQQQLHKSSYHVLKIDSCTVPYEPGHCHKANLQMRNKHAFEVVDE